MDETPGNSSARVKPRAATLPHFLFDPYQRYKRDTNRLASWLGATADSLGYRAQRPGKSTGNNPKPAVPGSGRLKGKSRKEAQAAQAFLSAAGSGDTQATRPTQPAADHDDSNSANVTYFTTSDFISLAEFIANFSDPPVTVPPRIIDWTYRAIHARRQCADWFASAAAAGRACAVTEESNRSHEHFTRILTSVASILAPRIGCGKVPGKSGVFKGKTDAAAVEMAEGRYSVLAEAEDGRQDEDADDDGEQDDWATVDKLVQETVGDRTAAHAGSNTSTAAKSEIPNIKRIRSNPFSSNRRVYRVKDGDELDFSVAHTTHLLDIGEVHRTIKDLWIEYFTKSGAPGAPSLQVVGLVMTAAADAIQADHDSLCKSYPTFMAKEHMYLDFAFLTVDDLSRKDIAGMCGRTFDFLGEIVEMPALPAGMGPPPVDFIFDTVAEGTCLGERFVLESLRQFFRQEEHWKERALGPEDVLDSILTPGLPSQVLAWKNRHAEMLVRDMEELRRLYVTWEQVKDSFTHLSSILAVIDTLDSIFRTDDPIPLPKLFAAKLFLIFHRLMVTAADDPDACRGRIFADAINSSGGQLTMSFVQCVTHVPETTRANMKPKNWNDFVRFNIDMMPWLFPKGLDHCEMFFLVHPWFAGAVTGRGLAMMHGWACEFEGRHPYIYAGAYLYAAVALGMQHLGLAPRDEEGFGGWWPRMDVFFKQVGGQERVFAGRKPDCIADLFKAVMIRIGVSPVQMPPAAGRASGVRQARRRRDRPSASHFQLKPLVYGAMPPVVKALFGRYDAFGHMPAERINEAHRAVGECLVDVGAGEDEGCGNGDNSENSNTTDRKSKKQPLKLLPLSEYITHIKSELIAEPALHSPLMFLRAQASRMITYLKTLFEAHIPLLVPHFQELGKTGDPIVHVAMFVSALMDTGIRDVAERRRILRDILSKLHVFVVEMVATEAELPKQNKGAADEPGDVPDSGDRLVEQMLQVAAAGEI